MKAAILTLLILCLHLCSTLGKKSYCNITEYHLFCKDRTYTCPKRKSPTVSKPTPDEKIEILETFNKFRQKLAKGLLKDGNNKNIDKYAFMKEMKYDLLLGKMAAKACKICSLNSLPEWDRQLFTYLPGQMVGSPNVVDDKVDWKNISWTNAIEKLFTDDMVHHYIKPETDQFGRLHSHNFVVWARKKRYKEKDIDKVYGVLNLYKDDNYKIGCAKSTYTKDGKPVYLFNCFTGPSNVFIPLSDNPQPSMETNLRLFSGDSTDKCHPSEKYDGLCKTSGKLPKTTKPSTGTTIKPPQPDETPPQPSEAPPKQSETASQSSEKSSSITLLQSFDANIFYLSLFSLMSF